jgi:tricorn protease
VFLSERETDTLNICHVWLRREDFERTRADREEEEDDKHDAPKKADEKKDPVRVEIDLDDIHLRVRLVTRYAAGVQEAIVAPDGEQIAYRSAYQGQPDLYVIKWDGSDERRLTTGGASPENLRWSKDGKTLYYLSRGRLQRIAASGATRRPHAPTPKSSSTSRASASTSTMLRGVPSTRPSTTRTFTA